VIEKEVHTYAANNCVYKYVYDDRNNCILETVYDENGNFQQQYESQFDAHNNEIRTTHMKNEKKIDFEIIYDLTYDSVGNWIIEEEKPTTEYLVPDITVRKIV